MDFIDTHAHLTSSLVKKDVKSVVERAHKEGIVSIINIATDDDSLQKGLKLSEAYPFIRNAAATTPHDVEKEGEIFFPIVKKHAQEKKLVAIGETGLDYFYTHSPKDKQKHYLLKYFELALSCDLPVIIHCRDAFEDLFHLADTYYPSSKLVIHCFTGTKEEALEGVKRGWKVSFSGIITFKKSVELRETVKVLPLDSLFIETDTPYLAPQAHRGEENEPFFVIETAKVIAEARQENLDTIASATTQNAIQFFSLSKP